MSIAFEKIKSIITVTDMMQVKCFVFSYYSGFLITDHVTDRNRDFENLSILSLKISN